MPYRVRSASLHHIQLIYSRERDATLRPACGFQAEKGPNPGEGEKPLCADNAKARGWSEGPLECAVYLTYFDLCVQDLLEYLGFVSILLLQLSWWSKSTPLAFQNFLCACRRCPVPLITLGADPVGI